MSDKDKLVTKNNEYNNIIKSNTERTYESIDSFTANYLQGFLETVKKDPTRVKDLPPAYRQEEKYRKQYLEIVETALSKNGLMIQHFSEFQGSLEMAKIATQNNPEAIQYFDETIRYNDELVTPLVEKKGKLLQYASPILKDNEEVVMKALETGASLKDASLRLQDTEDVVLKALEHNVDAFKYASTRLKGNEEFIQEAMSIQPSSFRHADASLRSNTEFCLELINKGFLDAFNDFEYGVRKNPEIITAAYDKMYDLNISLSRDINYYIENPYEFSNEVRPTLNFYKQEIREARENQQSIEL